MDEELELFREDVDEQLTFMENSLIAMQESGITDEDIGALFRAMHTIKGVAGMFGFDDVVSFAHVAESLLSEAREHKVVITPDMIEVFFQSKDHMQLLVDLALANAPLDAAMQETNDSLLKILTSMMPNAKALTNDNSVPVEESSENEVSSGMKLWHISFRLKPNFFSSGMDIVGILKFFDMLGEVKKKLFIYDDLPDIESINPTEAYIGYEILFETDISYAEIEEIFEFVADDIELEIFEADDLDMLQALVDTYTGLEQKLLDAGFEDVHVLSKGSVEKSEAASTLKEPAVALVKENNAPPPVKPVNEKKEKKSFSLRVDSSKIDQLINQISEMVIANAKVTQRADVLDDTELEESSATLSEMLEEIRTGIMNIRMVQVGDSFNKFKRIVQDVAKKVGKKIDFQIMGGETELDKMVVEKMSDPLMHMLRNSIDHGIETPEERVAAGKEETGYITLITYPDAGTIVIEISDDGRGLPKEKILQKAINNGLVSPNENLSDKEIYNLIFEAGLSTAEKVSDISGRGVGMDVVKRNIESLRGTVDIDSKPGSGSLFTIRLPLTLAIIDGFLIQSGNTKYIIPLEMIQECLEFTPYYKKEMDGNNFINLRDTILPLLDLRKLYDEVPTQSERENVVVVRYGEHSMGLVVDELYGEFQTVIKPLGPLFKNVVGISGGTILGSGEIALIFDIPKLMEYQIRKIK